MNKHLIIIIILFIAIISIVFWLILPIYNQISYNYQVISDKKNELQETKDLIAKMKELDEKYKQLEADGYIKKIDFALPEEEDLPSLIVNLEALASQNGMILEEADFGSQVSSMPKIGTATAPQPYNIFQMRLSLAGSYLAFKNFLKALEENLRLMDVKSVSLSPKEEIENYFKFDVAVETYYRASP